MKLQNIRVAFGKLINIPLFKGFRSSRRTPWIQARVLLSQYVNIFMRQFLIIVMSCIALTGIAQSFVSPITETLKPIIDSQASWALTQQPKTITSISSERSAGGPHDYFSEGDYWWADPSNPDGPYIQLDGQSNPDNFNAHRELLIRFSRIMGALGSKFSLTKDKRYVVAALQHANAWFVDDSTIMNPSLLYAQAIKGRATGRGIGIIDTIHLMEVVQALMVMSREGAVDDKTLLPIKNWFRNYLSWLTTHPYGIDEMNAKNNHGTCWVMQVACFAKFVGDTLLIEKCRKRFRSILLPNQMALNGSFPLELARTKPYGYSIFNLDAMATICQILSTSTDNLWEFEYEGKSMEKAIAFLYPYIEKKPGWPFPHDVMYWDEWPVAQPFLLFGSLAFRQTRWFDEWRILDHDPKNSEVLRNLPVRNPLIWIGL
jgi:hypothetical protein